MDSPNDAPKPLTPGQINGLTQALNSLTDAVKGKGASRQPGRPWWVQYAQYGAGADWDDEQSPPTAPPPQAPPQAQQPRRSGWWRKYVKAAGQTVTPPTAGATKPPQSQKSSPPPWVKAASRPWNRRPRSWNWLFTRKASAYTRQRFGARAGRAAATGLSAAGSALQKGWPVAFAARTGLVAAAGSLGPVGVGLSILAVAAVKATQSLNEMAKGQVEYARSLSHASAQMALVMAERDIQELMRNREKGDRLSTSARALTQAEQFKEDNTKEIDILIDKGKNYIGAAWEVFKTGLFLQMNLVAGGLNKIEEMISGAVSDQKRALTVDEWAKDTQKLDDEARKKKDPRWEPAKHNNRP